MYHVSSLVQGRLFHCRDIPYLQLGGGGCNDDDDDDGGGGGGNHEYGMTMAVDGDGGDGDGSC